MAASNIYITEFDRARLEGMIRSARAASDRDYEYLDRLETELDQAHVVEPRDVRPDVVTMNSQVRLQDTQTGQSEDYVLVFPKDADAGRKQISVLAPMGAALLGASVGQVVEWQVPGGRRAMRVEAVLYQPEAAGDYHL
ncbi:MAG: nucleoside diphosphate kinase regulator [Pseudomonadota bacterium]